MVASYNCRSCLPPALIVMGMKAGKTPTEQKVIEQLIRI